MRKDERTSRAAKRAGAAKRRAPAKQKAGARSRKTVRRVTAFKSTSWYAAAAQSIGISARTAQ